MVEGNSVVISKRGAKRYIVTDSEKEPKATTIDDEKLEEDEQWNSKFPKRPLS